MSKPILVEVTNRVLYEANVEAIVRDFAGNLEQDGVPLDDAVAVAKAMFEGGVLEEPWFKVLSEQYDIEAF